MIIQHFILGKIIIKLTVPVSMQISKRFTGGKKPIGHVHKLINAAGNALTKPHTSPTISLDIKTKSSLTYTKIDENIPTISTVTSSHKENLSHLTENLTRKILSVIPLIRSEQNTASSIPTGIQEKVRQGKEALAIFLDYFKTLADEDIKNPYYFLIFHKILTEKYPPVDHWKNFTLKIVKIMPKHLKPLIEQNLKRISDFEYDN